MNIFFFYFDIVENRNINAGDKIYDGLAHLDKEALQFYLYESSSAMERWFNMRKIMLMSRKSFLEKF